MLTEEGVSIFQTKDTEPLLGNKIQRPRSFSLKKQTRKPTRKRFVEKDGESNVNAKEIPRSRYVEDLFTTIVDAQWQWMISLFITCYLGSWLVFGTIWYLILLQSGQRCFTEVTNFTDTFMLSVETSMTIGYGRRSVSSSCPTAVLFLVIQSLASCLIEACIIGLIFTKIQRPRKRKTTLIFSKNAVITKRDDKICLMFNICDVRRRQLVECHVRLYLFRKYKTLEGNVICNYQDQLRVGMDWYNIRDDSNRLYLLFPCTAVHVIDRKSPFYHVSKKNLKANWELVVVLERTVEATGCIMQTKTSYLTDEIVWGADFVNTVSSEDWCDEKGVEYELSRLNDIVPVPNVPIISPAEYYKTINKDPDPNDIYDKQSE